MDLKTAINYICDHKVPVNSNARGRFQINNNYWYDFDIIRSADDYYSGFISGHTVSEAYQFYRMRGADPVLKKLGSQPFTATFYLDYTRGAGQNSDSKHFSGAGNSKINLDVTNYDKVTFSNLIVNGQEIQDVTANGTVVGNGSVLNLSSVSNLEIKMSGGGNLQGGKNWSGNVSITATFE